MKKSQALFIILTFSLLLWLSKTAQALEIDEKLTVRILKTSDTNRTVLVNRGLEDGLVVDDHAKFFITTGVIARAVAIKVSPTRSIWSVYRLVNDDRLYADSVMNLKITKPMELTQDKSRDLEDRDRGGAIEVPDSVTLAPGADDIPEGFDVDDLTPGERGEVAGLRPGASDFTGSSGHGRFNKNWELWGLLSFNSLSSSAELTDGSTITGSTSNIDFTGGLEVYRLLDGEFFKPLSFVGFVHKGTREVMTTNGSQSSLDSFGYGAGVHYNFFHDPMSFGKYIFHVGLNLGTGSTTDQENSLQSSNAVDSLEGTYSSVSAALGAKYYLSSGLGFRALLDYYQRSESYLLDDESEITKTLSGPRFQLGLAYRW